MKKDYRSIAKRAWSALLAFVLAAAFVPMQAIAAGAQAGGNAAADAAPSGYELISEAEASGNCAAGQAVVVYHSSGAAKGSTGTLAIQSGFDPLAEAGFSATQTWDLSAADSSQGAAAAAADGALSVLSDDGSELASGSDVRVALVEKDGVSVADLVAELESLEFVEAAGANYKYGFSSLTNDTLSDLQWGLSGSSSPVEGSTSGIGYAAAKASGSGTAANVVAVIDTGVDYSNPDLAKVMWTDPGDIGLGQKGSHGYNAYANTYDPAGGR